METIGIFNLVYVWSGAYIIICVEHGKYFKTVEKKLDKNFKDKKFTLIKIKTT